MKVPNHSGPVFQFNMIFRGNAFKSCHTCPVNIPGIFVHFIVIFIEKKAAYTHRNEGEDVPESVIEAFVVKIVVSKDGFDWYLRFDGYPDKPRRCTLQGKRKTTTKIMVSGENSPTMDSSPTGCHQGLSYKMISCFCVKWVSVFDANPHSVTETIIA